MKDRIKKIRNSIPEYGKTQESFAKYLGISKSNLSSYEAGRRTPSDAVIQLICQKCNVREEWLRTGQGDMYDIPLDDTAIAASNILENEDVPFYDTIKRIIQIYEKLDTDAQDVINKEIEDFLENAKKK